MMGFDGTAQLLMGIAVSIAPPRHMEWVTEGKRKAGGYALVEKQKMGRLVGVLGFIFRFCSTWSEEQ